MNRLLTVLILIIVLTFSLEAQTAWSWGKVTITNKEVSWGKIFPRTDSLYHVDNAATLDSSDTLYSDIIYVNSEGPGAMAVTFSADSSDAASDSIKLDIRKYYDKNIHTRPWALWKNIGGYMTSNSTYPYYYDLADSTVWYGPCTGWQFRVYRVDTASDTLTPNLGVYGN